MEPVRIVRILPAGVAALLAVLALTHVHAQLPPHRPGTICQTPHLWCWIPPQPVGSRCTCQTPVGSVAGTAV